MQGAVKGGIFFAQQGQHIQPQPVTLVLTALVAGILAPVNAAFNQQSSQRLRVRCQQRAQQAALVIAGGHAAKGRPSCTPREAQQYVFAHICRMVSKGYKIRTHGGAFLLQQGIAQLAGSIFNTDFAPCRQPAYIGLPHSTANV